MATIPDVTDLGARPIPRRARGLVSDQSGEILADAGARFGAKVSQVANQIVERDDSFRYAQAKSALLQADVEARKSLDNDTDWENYETKYQSAMNKALEGASKQMRSRRDQSLFGMDAKLDMERGLQEIRTKAKAKEVDWGRSSLITSLEGNRNAALTAGDEATRASLINTTHDAIRAAEQKGYLSAVEAANMRQKWTTDYADAYVGMQPATKRIELLNKPKETPADLLAPDRRAALLEAAKKEDRDLTVRRESQAQEDTIVSKHGGNWSAALKTARDIEDPEVRDSTVIRIKVRQAEAKAAESEFHDALAEQALSFLNGGGEYADLPLPIKNGLKPSELNSLRAYAEQQAGGGSRRTNPETLIELSDLSAADPQAFGELSMLAYRDKLSDSDFEEFVDLQRKIKTGTLDGKSTGFMSLNDVRNERLRDLFGSTMPAAKESEKTTQARRKFVTQYEGRLRAFRTDAGKSAKADDARKILDDMTADVAINRSFWFDEAKPAFALTIDDIPDAEGQEIVAELKKHGKPVTEKAVLDWFIRANRK